MTHTNKNYTIITTQAQLTQAKLHIEKSLFLGFDTETTGLNVRKSQVIGISFCGSPGESFYAPRFSWNKETEKLEQVLPDSDILELLHLLSKKELLMWNAAYDISIVKNDLKVDLIDSLLADIMLMKHTVEEEGNFALKEVAKQYQSKIGLDVESDANEEQIELKHNIKMNGGSITKTNYEMYKADLEVMGKYAASDADLTLRLAILVRDRLSKDKLEEFFYDKEVMPLYKEVTIPMENNSIKLDIPLILKTKANIESDLAMLEDRIVTAIESNEDVRNWKNENLIVDYPQTRSGSFSQEVIEYFDCGKYLTKTKNGKYSLTEKSILLIETDIVRDYFINNVDLEHNHHLEIAQRLSEKDGTNRINIFSKKQMADLVFKCMKIKPLSTTDKGNAQFNDDMIDHLFKVLNIKWAGDLSNYNSLIKIKGTYIDRFLDESENGYFYPNFQQHRTISGRYSSNLQQLPRPKETGELDEIVLKYNNVIREFFIADEGRVFIDNDYEALEPHCVCIDSKVEIKDKGILEISKVEVGDYINTVHGWKKLVNKWNSKKDMLEIITKKGVVRCSPDHKIYVNGTGWKKAEDIVAGDILEECKFNTNVIQNNSNKLNVYLKGANKPFSYLPLSAELCWMLGAFLGDGVACTTTSKYVGICGLKADMVTTKFKEIMESFGAKPKDYLDRRTYGMESCVCHDSWLVDIFKQTFDMMDDRSKKFHIPDYIMTSSIANRLSFLAGLIDTDGTFNQKKSELSISTKSAKLASDICSLGNTLGLDGRIGKAHKGVHKVYQIRFTAISINKLVDYKLYNFIACERKKIFTKSKIGKLKSPDAIVLEVNKKEQRDMVDITVDGVEEFICDNIRVHNCFSHVSGDEGLRDIFRKGYDFYSTIAIATEKLKDVSADKNAPNYLGKVNKPKRSFSKAYSLGVPYGMGAYALGKTLNVTTEEAQVLINGYLNGFPKLKEWMKKSEYFVKANGYIKIETGRIRHLPAVKELYRIHGDKLLDYKYKNALKKKYEPEIVEGWYKDYKNGLNNAKNVQIQGLAASIVNMAAIQINREFKKRSIDALVILNIHDQLVIDAPKSKAEECRQIVQDIMENNYRLSIALKAPAVIGTNLKDAH